MVSEQVGLLDRVLFARCNNNNKIIIGLSLPLYLSHEFSRLKRKEEYHAHGIRNERARAYLDRSFPGEIPGRWHRFESPKKISNLRPVSTISFLWWLSRVRYLLFSPHFLSLPFFKSVKLLLPRLRYLLRPVSSCITA